MQFLLECVSCGRSRPSEPSEPATEMSPRSEETRSLVLPTPLPRRDAIDRVRRRKRPARSSVSEWRPSLLAISEETVVGAPEKLEWKRTVESGRQPKRHADSTAPIRGHGRDFFGHDHHPTVVPAFSPIPFMF
ncbi:hypothetical protein Nepgr_007529 [Nepenthes gracilis]|uniref:Uncharacterized protein n=1 Tax=Nepenthes gracilis TaxID=150966 RepID=A0AAD3S7C9_NEPGR|nr:hypothetical protein Nepgr_007529 [Nepenthes gracilis]